MMRHSAWMLTGLATVALMGAGCASTVERTKNLFGKPAPVAGASTATARAAATFSPKVILAPDPTRGGAEVIGLLGRLFILDKEGTHMIETTGVLKVDLYDHTHAAGDTPPVMLEHWIFDPETLKKLGRKDMFGYGFSLFLPWSTHRKDISKIYMVLRFEPEGGGEPLMYQTGVMSIDHSMLDTGSKSQQPPQLVP